MTDVSDIAVREFRQILIWPVQLMPLQAGCGLLNHWDFLDRDPARTWVELDDEFPERPEDFQERHYREFAAFLPHVQRFLYGERASRTGRTTYGESPIRIFRRADVKKARLRFHGEAEATEVDVAHTDLYFFFDVDVAILVVEIAARDLPLCRGRRTSSIASAAPIPPAGARRAPPSIVPSASNGSARTARFSRPPTTRRARNI